jgi:SAM-dependent methyltransferase
MGGVLDTVHGGLVHERRVRVLAHHLAELIPHGARLVDVGCGDGRIDALIHEQRPDIEVSGIDIGVREETLIPVQEFDGRSIPLGDRSVDVVMLVDVLHHAEDPHRLLAEAVRVADRAVVLKDVTNLGPGSDATLRFMDWVGNARHGVPLPYAFWSQEEWRDAFGRLDVDVEEVRRRLGLYPWPANLLFEKRMHFILRLVPRRRTGAPAEAET